MFEAGLLLKRQSGRDVGKAADFARSGDGSGGTAYRVRLSADQIFQRWIGLFLVVAAVFNPIVPLHLTRGVWSILNIAAGALFVGHFVVDRRDGKQTASACGDHHVPRI